ncbi:MAG: hypothetical protein Q8O34_17680 [Rhodocyclaceae bacterium]|nr:hypothetical protein [Rhodocyclaceae bacterium]
MAACIVGWAHSPFGRLDGEDPESLIVGVGKQAMADAGCTIDDLAGVFNMGGSAVANYVSILEAAR